jgi:hypothetical protein
MAGGGKNNPSCLPYFAYLWYSGFFTLLCVIRLFGLIFFYFFASRGQHGPTTQGCALEKISGLQHLRPEGSDLVRGEPLTDKQAQADGHLHSTGRAPECPGSTPACRARRARMHLHSTWGNVVHGCQLSSGSPGAGRPLVGCGARAGSLPAALGSRSGSQPPRALAQDPGAAIW